MDGVDSVGIFGVMFNDFTIKSTGMPSKLKLQAMTEDEIVKPESVELTIRLCVENQPYFDVTEKGHGYLVYGLFLSSC